MDLFDSDIPLDNLTAENIELLKNLKVALDTSSIIAVTNNRGEITYANDRFCHISKFLRTELIGSNHRILNSNFHSKNFFKEMWRTIGTGNVWKGEIRNRAKDGSIYWVDTIIVPFLNENNKPYQYISFRNDITEKKRMEESLHLQEERIKALIQHSNEGIAILDQDFTITYMSPTYEKITNRKANSVIDKDVLELIHPDDKEKCKCYLIKAVKDPQTPYKIHIRAIHDDGLYYIHELVLTNFIDYPGINGIVVNFRNITEEKRLETQIQHNTFFDPNTNLPTRLYLDSRLKSMVNKGLKSNERFVLGIFDIDDFKHINDMFGHDIGDMFLKEIAKRLTECLSKESFIARLGGDEFAIIIPDLYSSSQLEETGKRIMELFTKPILINEYEFFCSISLGFCKFPEDGNGSQTLLAHANNAMTFAKKNGKNHFSIYDGSIQSFNYRSFTIKNSMRKAIEEEQFLLHFQPRINVKTLKIEGFESLIRWDHPELGLISPFEFIPIAEQTGLMGEIGDWVFKKSCEYLTEINSKSNITYKMSINFSPNQFLNKDIVDRYLQILRESHISPSLIEIEITESLFIHNKKRVAYVLNAFRTAGFSLALDDFGTGYSSLSYLKEFKTDVIKIDKSFVEKITVDQDIKAIAEMIIRLAHQFNMRVVGEGVETTEQLSILKDLHCDEIQGYYFSKPLPYGQNLLDFIESYHK
ncbi:diguanylate cyclase (GGDEF)-like protein/PAS domain S-box-containing protein [Salirhabdus euzebyi]|uniref:Diguanylate cyclase (GGDEF)-like protein/PAS domain S-box-containing protein n=1 Tax=Salirhabdus euzebyi TaxID=394506 RepID=A0A841Q2D3_9BACI|nr:GGDEF domain-containing phosphodiesterase [Salirhabdus euzebyi]MBB6452702.1 diguanylate cyclase (GGDEF)-like protein/PAS domain S-box-containing protein [Salirhabdus euzebyi]